MDACSAAVDSLSPARYKASAAELNRPFLKWAGNKFRILHHIQPLLPRGQRLIEPFAGSGALFLNSEFDHYLLSDRNADLISLYNILKQDGEEFIDYCAQYFVSRNNQEKRYYRFRDQFNDCDEPHLRAALFVYLNRHGYNGLCRYNAGGGFNVPFGRYKRPYFPAREMRRFHHKAQRAEFQVCDFEQVIQQAGKGDVIYCDPPYVPLSASANFTSYSAGGFDLDQQALLAQLASNAAQRGIPVLISNHNTPFTRKTYQSATKTKRFKVQRYISCNGNQRNTAGEILALYQ